MVAADGGLVGLYDDLVARKGTGSPFDGLTTDQPPAQAPDALPWATPPADYVGFLRDVGWGAFAGGSFTLYSGLIPAEEVYDRPGLGEIRLLGDDLAGYSIGYQLPAWRLVELDPRARIEPLASPDFQSFIRDRIAREDQITAGQGEGSE